MNNKELESKNENELEMMGYIEYLNDKSQKELEKELLFELKREVIKLSHRVSYLEQIQNIF